MTNSMPSMDLDNNPQFCTATQGFVGIPNNDDLISSTNNESSNPKGRVEFDLNFEPAMQRLDLVNEFDLEMNNIKWVFKKDNMKVEQKKLQKRNKKQRKKKTAIDFDTIKKSIEDNYNYLDKLDEKFDL